MVPQQEHARQCLVTVLVPMTLVQHVGVHTIAHSLHMRTN